MAINAGTVFINVAANTGPFRQQMLGLGSQVSKVGSTISRVGTGLSRALTLPLGLAGAASVKLALDYEEAFTKINAVTGASREEITKWREDVLTLSGKTAQAPTELADALYTLASAGLKPSQVFPTLRASAKAAAVGMGDVNSVARLVTAALNAYGPKALDAAKATDILVSAVKEGRAEPEEFGDAIGRILPIAKNAKVSFEEVAGSLAAVSNVGLDVNEGITAMRGLMKALIVPGTQAEEQLKKIGISTVELRDLLSNKGLLGTMQILEKETKDKFGKGWLDAMNKIIPNIRALTGGLGLTVQEASRVQAIFDKVAHSQGEADKAFNKTTKGPMFQFQQGLNQLRIAGIKLGQDLLPIVLEIVHTISDWAKAFTNLSPAMQSAIVKWGIFLALLGPALRILGSGVTLVSGLARGIGFLVTKLAGLGTGAAAAGFEQLTLFGGGGAAAAGGGAVAGITAGLSLAAAAAIYVKIAYDDMNEAVDKNVELLRQGKLSTTDLTEENKKLGQSAAFATAQTQNQGLSAKFASGEINGMGDQISRNNEAIQRFTDGVRHMALSFGVSKSSASDLASIFKTSQGTTEAYRHKIAAMVGGLEQLGGKLKDVTVKQLRNLLAQGDTAAAYRLLNREITNQSHKWGEHAKEVGKVAKESRDADHAQRLLAGGVKNAEQAMRQAGNAVKEGSDKLRDFKNKARDANNQKVQPSVGLRGIQGAQGQLSAFENHLVEVTQKDWHANIRLTTSGGSTGFHLIAELTKALEAVTEKGKWNVDIKVAEDSSLQWVSGMLKNSQRELEKLGQVASDVWGQEFPKAYADDVAAFKKATTEKSNELEKQLKQAQKTFDKLSEKVKSFKDQIRSGFADSASLVSGAIEGLQRTVDQVITDSEGNESTIQIAAPIDISSFLQEQIAQAKDFAQKLAKLAADGLAPAILGELASQGQSALPLIDALLSGGKDMITEFNNAQKTIKKFGDLTADALSEEKFGGAIKRARNNIDRLSERIDNFAHRLDSQADQLAQGLRQLGNATQDTVNAIYRAIGNMPGGGGGGGRTRMAAGGVVTRATNITAGEAGPEAIIPLDKAKLTTSAPVNVYITVEGNVIRESDLAAAVRDKLLRDKRFKGTLGLG